MSLQGEKLIKSVVNQGLCTHCGTCIALAQGKLGIASDDEGIIPKIEGDGIIENIVYDACPGKGLNYPELFLQVQKSLPDNFMIGPYLEGYIAYSNDESIRRQGASAGILSHVLIHLLESGKIQGAIVCKMDEEKPWNPKVYIAGTKAEILESAQSIYQPVPVNLILKDTAKHKGTLAMVGLPDQLASIRYLQKKEHPSVKNIAYLIGPYVGINMTVRAVHSFIRSNGVKNLDAIKSLDYRAGEWPGYLKIVTKDHRVFKAEKFYYNYLLPFYATRHSLLSVDFSNELADISVGDAWHPAFEKERKGFSVVVIRSSKGREIFDQLKTDASINAEKLEPADVLDMHGHMFDFKKRGAFIRIKFRKLFFRHCPDYGYVPEKISVSRYFVEIFIWGVFLLCQNRMARTLVRYIPVNVIGYVFNKIRIGWKSVSKPTKRKGIKDQVFRLT